MASYRSCNKSFRKSRNKSNILSDIFDIINAKYIPKPEYNHL